MVQEIRDLGLKGMVAGQRHPVLVHTTMRLVRLGQQGHTGVNDALEQVHDAFVAAAAPDRPSGRREAQEEWDRAVHGAVEKVSRSPAPSPDACCVCQLALLWQAYHDERFFTGGRSTYNERLVLRYLLYRVRCRSSWVVDESQRQIAEVTDLHASVVHKVLNRLQELGWVQKMASEALGWATRRRLCLPPGADPVLCSPGPLSPAEYLGASSIPLHTHPLFSQGGLGPLLQDVFGLLPEERRSVRRRPGSTGRRRGWAVRKVKDLPVTAGLLDRQVQRRLPPATVRGGATAKDLAGVLGLDVSTVRGRLRRLQTARLVFTTRVADRRDVLWWRYRLDPDDLVERLGFLDSRAGKRLLHQEQRRLRRQQLSENAGQREWFMEKGRWRSVDTATGELGPDPPV